MKIKKESEKKVEKIKEVLEFLRISDGSASKIMIFCQQFTNYFE